MFLSTKTAESFPSRWWRRSWPTLHHHPRSNRWMRAVAAMLLVLSAFHTLSMGIAARRALEAKYHSTIYTHLTSWEAADVKSARWRWENQPSLAAHRYDYSREDLLANRHEWKKLGAGFEGETFTYGDAVVKVYKTDTAPFRDCVPGANPAQRWPTEIAASVILGGMAESAAVPDDADFLPVVDYFLSPATQGQPQKWHFLTPFLPSGNLANLARTLRNSDTVYTARDVDVIFRPSLNRILGALHTMHAKDLCHDDIKLDNIFLASPEDEAAEPNKTTHWLLADLGNVRQVDHPYHSSIIWSSLNDNLPDCRANDVVRLLKSYMFFLRSSVADTSAFDTEFFTGAQPWSRLFWSIHDDVSARRPMSAAEAIQRSVSGEKADGEPHWSTGRYARPVPGLRNPMQRLMLGWEETMARATMEALRVSAGDKIAKRWGVVPLLGMPVPECDSGL